MIGSQLILMFRKKLNELSSKASSLFGENLLKIIKYQQFLLILKSMYD
jgi:hypothetical protein